MFPQAAQHPRRHAAKKGASAGTIGLAVIVVLVLSLAVATPALLRRRRDAIAAGAREGGGDVLRPPLHQAATRLTIAAKTAGDVTGSR